MKKDPSLDRLIENLKARPLPDCPESLESQVLRRARSVSKEQEAGFIEAVAPLWSNTKLATMTLVLGIIASSLLALVTSSAYAQGINKRMQTQEVLHFDTITDTRLLDFNP